MASLTGIVSGIAGRYAVALFEMAEAEKVLDTVAGDLDALGMLLGESAELRELVSSPLISRTEQSSAIVKVAAEAGFHTLTKNTLGVLAANRRLGYVKAVIRDFGRLLAHHRGEIAAEVTTARPLTKTQLADLTKKLKLAMGRDVAVEEQVDESLIGGIVVRVGSRMVDGSLRTKLDNLAIAMKGVQ